MAHQNQRSLGIGRPASQQPHDQRPSMFPDPTVRLGVVDIGIVSIRQDSRGWAHLRKELSRPHFASLLVYPCFDGIPTYAVDENNAEIKTQRSVIIIRSLNSAQQRRPITHSKSGLHVLGW